MMVEREAVEEFPPSSYLQEFIDDRGWTQDDLATILGRPSQVISEIMNDKRRITPDTAKGLAQAFDTSAELWLNLDAAWQLYKSRDEQSDFGVSRRARLYTKGPLKEMAKRGWIELSTNPDVLEQRVLDFFQTRSLDEEPSILSAARMSTSYEGFSAAQVAWMCRAAQLGRTLHVKGQFTAKAVERAVDGLRRLLIQPEEIRNVPKVLSDCGIRLVVVQHLSTTKIDGACIWLDKKSPVIALSLRHGRIDAFWFTLMHELGHVARGDGMGNALLALDEHLADEEEQADQRPRFEIEADDFAEEALVSQEALKNFIRRKGPLFSERDIRGFAMLHEVHPGVVVGQLHHQWSKKPGHGVHWSKFRKLLIQAREHILGVALTDGFGHAVPTVP